MLSEMRRFVDYFHIKLHMRFITIFKNSFDGKGK